MKRGFSIVELLVVISILVLLFMLILYIYLAAQQAHRTGQSSGLLYNKVELATGQAAAQFKEGAAVHVSYDAPPLYATSAITAVIAVPSIDNDGKIISQTFDTVVLNLENGNFMSRTYPHQASSRPARTVTLLKNAQAGFQYYDDEGNKITNYTKAEQTVRVSIALTAEESVGGRTNTAQLQTYATLRNR